MGVGVGVGVGVCRHVGAGFYVYVCETKIDQEAMHLIQHHVSVKWFNDVIAGVLPLHSLCRLGSLTPKSRTSSMEP